MQKFCLLLVLIGLVYGKYDLDCEQPVHSACREVLGMKDKYASFPETEEELAKHCHEKLTLVDCMHYSLGHCGMNQYLSELHQYVQSQKEVLARICNKDGDFRELYLKSGECMNEYLDSSTPELDEILDIGLEEGECETHRDEQLWYLSGFAAFCGEETKRMMEEVYKPALTFEDQICKKEKRSQNRS